MQAFDALLKVLLPLGNTHRGYARVELFEVPGERGTPEHGGGFETVGGEPDKRASGYSA